MTHVEEKYETRENVMLMYYAKIPGVHILQVEVLPVVPSQLLTKLTTVETILTRLIKQLTLNK